MSELSLHRGDPSVLRRLNSAATLRALRGAGEPTLTELARRTGLSRPTTEAVLTELVVRGLVEEVAPQAGNRLGRPARRYRFRAEAGHALGIDIDAQRALVFLSDLDGHVLGSHRAELEPGWPPRERLAAVRAAVKVCLAGTGTTRADLWAVAAGTPGVVAPDGRVAFCTVVPGWQGVDLGRELSRSFTCPVLVENDANLAAVAERWRGVATDVDDVVYVLAGVHTGAGAIIGGRLRRGRWGAAGEVGMLPELGWRDTAAALASPSGPSAALDALDASGSSGPSGGPGASDGLDAWAASGASDGLEAAAVRVLAAAEGGDASAQERVRALAARMARGVAALVLAVDPEMVVVGGALTLAGGALVDELRRQVRPLCLSPTRVEASVLGDESVGLGALRLALDRVEQDLLTP